jgi:hypothetical protein
MKCFTPSNAPVAHVPSRPFFLKSKVNDKAGTKFFAGAASPLGVQAKLKVGDANDALEQEADRVADQVVDGGNAAVNHMPAAPTPQRKCEDCEREEKTLQRKVQDTSESTGLRSEVSVPDTVSNALNSQARPLDPATRAVMEPRFGHDFGHVRVHRGAEAAGSAKVLGAKAYTLGRDIVFGEGYYAPGSRRGDHLLAHELTHVVQQGHLEHGAVIQRSEVDDRSCAGLTDIETDIDTKVNAGIAAARAAAPTPLVLADFLKDVSGRLGGQLMGAIEMFIKNLPATKRTSPPQNLASTKFAGVDAINRFYLLHTLGSIGVIGPSAKVKGFCVGSDKFGHFFEEGFIYFLVSNMSGGGSAGSNAAQSTGRFLEISNKQGLGVTGVFSNADLAANLAGKKFYEDLAANPSSFSFSVANYISDKWSETFNPSFYNAAEGSVIWANLLSGTWQGSFTSAGGTSTPTAATVTLRATAAGQVTGTNEWPAGAAKPNKEKIKNGVISQRTTAVSGTFPDTPPQTLSDTPVSGVTIAFDWELRSASGKGELKSVDEQNLVGTWGIGSSKTNGGTWTMKKV